jgi:outer membrane protein assembly factor BamB
MISSTRAAGLILSVSLLSGADWPRFRGPDGLGVAVDTKNLPTEFGPAKNVVWKTALPPGHSSPIITGDYIFLTAGEGGRAADAGRDKIVDEGGKLYVYAIQRRTGEVLWRREVPRPRLERYQTTNSPASPSPVVDRDSVYVFFGDFGLISYDFRGKERWRLALGPFNNVNGHGSSPVLAGDRLIMLCDQDSDSYLLAVDKRNGRVLWKTSRPEVTRSYTTPGILSTAGGDQIIVPGAYYLTAYSAKTGEKLWWVRGMSWQPKSTPIIHGDMVYAHWWEYGGEAETAAEIPEFAKILAEKDSNKNSTLSMEEYSSDPKEQRGFINMDLDNNGILTDTEWENYRARRASRNTLVAVKTNGRGDVTATHLVWSMQKFLPNVPTPLIYENVMYLVKDGGILTTVNPTTGRIGKQGRLTGAIDTYYSSPVAGAGFVFFAGQNGKVSVIQAGSDWKLLAVNDMEEEIYATPALVENRIYLRTKNNLYCFSDISGKDSTKQF